MEDWRPWTLRHLVWRSEAIHKRIEARESSAWQKVAWLCYCNAMAQSAKPKQFARTVKVDDYNPTVKTPHNLTEGERIAGIREAKRGMPETWEEFKARENARRK